MYANAGGGYLQAIHVDVDQLANYIQWKMDEEELSLRDVAREAKVSAPTLSRLLQKGKRTPRPDVDTLGRLIQWLNIPLEKIIDTSVRSQKIDRPRGDTLELIQVHLRADKNLSAEAARAIADMVKAAYRQFSKPSRGRV
jgi:transcriptional regulator with XRE-family HTH domain